MPYYNIYPEYSTNKLIDLLRENRPDSCNPDFVEPLYSEYIDNPNIPGRNTYNRYVKMNVNNNEIIAKYLTEANTGYNNWFDDEHFDLVYYPESKHSYPLFRTMDNIGIYGEIIKFGDGLSYTSNKSGSEYISYNDIKLLESVYTSGESYSNKLYGSYNNKKEIINSTVKPNGDRVTVFNGRAPYISVNTVIGERSSLAVTNINFQDYTYSNAYNEFLISPIFLNSDLNSKVRYCNIFGFQSIYDYEDGIDELISSQSYLGVLLHKYYGTKDTTCMYNAVNIGTAFCIRTNSKYQTLYVDGNILKTRQDIIPNEKYYLNWYNSDLDYYQIYWNNPITSKRSGGICSTDSKGKSVTVKAYDGYNNSTSSTRDITVSGLGIKTAKPVFNCIASKSEEGDIVINKIEVDITSL